MQATRGTSLSSTDQAEPADHASASPSPTRRLFVVVALAAYAVDPGAAFSTGTSYTIFLSAIALIAAGVVIRFGRRLGDRTWAVALGLLLAGVCGNLTDRLFREPGVLRGHVVDFLELPHWPVFNVADMLIDAGVVLIVIQTWRGIGITGHRHQRS
jgi:signal peptidase II